MDRKYFKSLKRELSDELENDLYVSDLSIVDKLIEENYLSSDDWEAIRAIYRPKKQVRQLIHCLGKAKDTLEAYRALCRLLDSNHKHLKPRVNSVLDKYELKEANCILRKRRKEPQALRVPDEHDENDDNLYNKPSSTPAYSEHSQSIQSPCRHANSKICIRDSLILKTETSDLNRGHCLKRTSPSRQYRDNNTLNVLSTPFSSQNDNLFEGNGHNLHNLQNFSRRRDTIRLQPIECENTDVSSEEEMPEYHANSISDESISTCKLCQRDSIQTSSMSKGQQALESNIPVCSNEENTQFTSTGNFSSRGRTVMKSDEEIHYRVSNHLTNCGHGENESQTSNLNCFQKGLNEAGESTKYQSNFDWNIPVVHRSSETPTCAFRVENVFSDIECNIHMENSAHYCKECSHHVFDENRNRVRDKIIQKPPCAVHTQNNEYSQTSSESENNESSLGQTYNCESNSHITGPLNAFNKFFPAKSIDLFQNSSTHRLSFCRKGKPLHVTLSKTGSKSHKQKPNTVDSFLNTVPRRCWLKTRIADESPSSSESASSSLEIRTNSSESEINTDVSHSDLNALEIKLFDKIAKIDGNLSDFMDSLIEQGYITEDDICSIQSQLNDEKRAAMLAKVLCRPKKLTEHDEVECVLKHQSSDTEDTDDERENSGQEAKNALYKHPVTILRDFGKTFDSLNDKVNNGYLEISLFPTDPDEACITYHLQACDKLYHNDADAAELLIAKASQAASNSKHQMQLLGEIFTAKTWLYLITGRTGKMLDLLQQYEQLLGFMPGMWSSTARGWFYHDYARCYLKLLNLCSTKHIEARRNYKQQALKSARKAIEYFKDSDNSDGPIGIGFAASLVIDALVEATENLEKSAIDITVDDIKEAENVCQFIERQFDSGIPPVLKSSYLLNKSRICYRKYELQDALTFARETMKLAQEINLHSIIRLTEKQIATIQTD